MNIGEYEGYEAESKLQEMEVHEGHHYINSGKCGDVILYVPLTDEVDHMDMTQTEAKTQFDEFIIDKLSKKVNETNWDAVVKEVLVQKDLYQSPWCKVHGGPTVSINVSKAVQNDLVEFKTINDWIKLKWPKYFEYARIWYTMEDSEILFPHIGKYDHMQVSLTDENDFLSVTGNKAVSNDLNIKEWREWGESFVKTQEWMQDKKSNQGEKTMLLNNREDIEKQLRRGEQMKMKKMQEQLIDADTIYAVGGRMGECFLYIPLTTEEDLINTQDQPSTNIKLRFIHELKLDEAKAIPWLSCVWGLVIPDMIVENQHSSYYKRNNHGKRLNVSNLFFENLKSWIDPNELGLQ